MDRHDVSDEVTAEIVAQLHQEDLKIQHKFDCKGMTYWFDDQRKTAFCLIEAPNSDAVKKMHDSAHGEVPHRIIEVDDSIVESFLGRIEDPKKSQNTRLNIINDPAFRTLMVVELNRISLRDQSYKKLFKCTLEEIGKFNGRIVKQKRNYILTSFVSVTKAVLCALEIQKLITNYNSDKKEIEYNIGLNAGVPVTEKDGLFEEAVKMAERFCAINNKQIVMSSEVIDLYEGENQNITIDSKLVKVIYPSDTVFLNTLMEHIEKEWSNTSLNVEIFSKNLGYSKSKLYRKIMPIAGKSLNAFLKEYRLSHALRLLNEQSLNVSEIAFETGFNSPTYFTREFKKRYGYLPTQVTRMSGIENFGPTV